MSEVVLYWYDITQGMARNLSPMFLGRQLEGVWHTSIVAYGCEFYFVGGVGILRDTTPGATRFGVPFRRSPLGRTTKTADEFLRWTVDQRGTNFGPWSYSLLTNNCNHFTQAASQFLLQMDIPADIRDMIPNLLSTPLGQMLRPTLERMTSMMEGAASSVGLNPATRSMDVHTTGSPVNVSQPPATPGTGGLLSLRSGLSSSEEDDLSLALVMLESNELVADGKVEGYQNTLLALTTLMTVWQNIMDHPTEAKYRGLSTSSETYRTKIAPLEDFGVVDLLHLAGFRIRPHASGNGGQQWALSDNDGSLPVLQRLTSEVEGLINNMECSLAVAMSLAEENARVEAERAASAPSVLEYFLSPVPEDFTPLHVGSENGAPLFSILVDEVHGSRHCFGKCRFVSDRHLVEGSPTQIEAYYCSPDGKEVRLPSGCAYRLLCVRKGCEDQLLWLPSSMIACSPSVEDFMYRGYGRFGVVRAPIRGSVHPGVREPAGRCVVPYGGEARVVTEVAQVLCERACMPEEVLRIADELYDGEHRLTEWEHQQGMCPMGSFDELLSWEPPTLSDAQTVCPLHPRAPRRGNSGSSAKVLLCHDMRGGYLEGDAPFFTCSSSMGGPVVDGSYTLQHWSSVDAFVYFSHHRVTVPPREWVSAGHRHGVPVLGTIIVEGGAGEAECDFMLIDAQRMARIVEQLVRLCDHHHFDGYMLNMESPMDVTLAQRLPAFCSMLRQKLNESAAAGTMRSVVWYDAVTIDGNVFYQNALTLKNKAFFDVCDGIMTNYFWNPMHIALSRTAAANRPEDVFVGVDVFGRRMFGGGGYNTSVAVENAVRGGLSVALFAPGWSMEVEGGGSREKFLRSDARLWSKMLKHLAAPHTLTLEAETSLPAWTAFSSGIGRGPFRVAGKSVTSAGSHWCSLSSAHTFLRLVGRFWRSMARRQTTMKRERRGVSVLVSHSPALVLRLAMYCSLAGMLLLPGMEIAR